MDINLRGTFFLTQYAAKRMAKTPVPRAGIIRLTSTGRNASLNRAGYCISKAGLSMAAKTFCRAAGEYGVNVYEIRPGIIDTDMIAPVRERYETLLAGGLAPLGRISRPDDIADTVSALAAGALRSRPVRFYTLTAEYIFRSCDNMVYIKLNSYTVPYNSLAAAVVGSGAAGLACSDRLHRLGVRDIALVTEGMEMGTSRNTGSDKQTYYKLSLTGDRQDSVVELAKSLSAGGAMHSDLALVEAAGSARRYRSCRARRSLPPNDFGEYVAYRTTTRRAEPSNLLRAAGLAHCDRASQEAVRNKIRCSTAAERLKS